MFHESASRRFVMIACFMFAGVVTLNTITNYRQSQSIIEGWNELQKDIPNEVTYRSTVILVKQSDDGTLQFQRVLHDTTTTVPVVPVARPDVDGEDIVVDFIPTSHAIIDTISGNLPMIREIPVTDSVTIPPDSISKYIWRRWCGVPYRVERIRVPK